MAVIRTPPSGPVIAGTAENQLLFWNPTTNDWEVRDPYPSIKTEFDFILWSRDDLVAAVAPVGGVFTLPRGSYFFGVSIVLEEGERIVIDDSVFMMGGGTYSYRGIAGNYADNSPYIEVQSGGVLYAYQMDFRTTTVARHGIRVEPGGSFVAVDCEIQTTGSGTQPGLSVGGLAVLTRTVIGSGVGALALTDGAQVEVTDCRFTANAAGQPCVDVNATSPCALRLIQSRVIMNGAGTDELITVASADSNLCEFFAVNSYLYRVKYDGSMCSLAGSTSGIKAHWVHTRFDANTNAGVTMIAIDVAGDVSDVVVSGCEFQDMTQVLSLTAGASESVRFTENIVGPNVVTGVTWATASLPTEGLIESQNFFKSGTPFSGHASTDALVLRRENFLSGVRQTESVITP